MPLTDTDINPGQHNNPHEAYVEFKKKVLPLI